MYVCMYVCIYVCMYVYMYVCRYDVCMMYDVCMVDLKISELSYFNFCVKTFFCPGYPRKFFDSVKLILCSEV